MPKIRTLIVDDSSMFRQILSQDLSSDPDIEICGMAPNGQIGLAKIAELKPDIVTLDIEMPVMDGMQTLAAIRKTSKTLPVIMFSTLTERGAAQTMEALTLGASDYVTKLPLTGSPKQHIRSQLIPKIKALCKRIYETQPRDKPVVLDRFKDTVSTLTSAVKVLVIGVSTGGPNALAELLPCLRSNLAVPILIVQHMPPMFTRLLAERLNTLGTIPVTEAKMGDLLRPGCALLAPGGYHIELAPSNAGMCIKTTDAPPENSCRPAVDVLFRSAAKNYGAGVLAIVLTGMGQDGLLGCEKIKEAHGHILVQDEPTSVVWGMPGAVYQAGLADKAMPIQDLATEINRRVSSSPSVRETQISILAK